MEELTFDQDKLCRGLRAVGLRKDLTLQLVNIVSNWVKSSGVEWTVERLKAIHHWYITKEAGKPEPPSWIKRGKDQLPLGPWKSVFKDPNQQRSLAALSMHTIFVSDRILPKQEMKFREALAGNGCEPGVLLYSGKRKTERPSVEMKDLTPPGLDCITGVSIPVDYGMSRTLRVSSMEDRVEAYGLSWKCVPAPTFKFLLLGGAASHIPPGFGGGWRGAKAAFPDPVPFMGLNLHSSQMRVAGRVSCIQEPSLKARWIANPNRITQHYLRPFGEMLYKKLRSLKTDCTFEQGAGTEWVQRQLSKGVHLTGTDLSSATDLLDMTTCVRNVVKRHYDRDTLEPSDWKDAEGRKFLSHINHFTEVARLQWNMGRNEYVTWNQGQPLGTYPSFAILGLTNNLLCEFAAACAGKRTREEAQDSYRVLGDDVIMRSELAPYYEKLVREFGGVSNPSKTVTSNEIGEFAGRIITPDRVMLKRVKMRGVGDNSFIEAVSLLGEQSKSLLNPRQLRMYEEFKFVPGYLVEGPYSKESFGLPLADRYFWYLKASGLGSTRPERDRERLSWPALAAKVRYSFLAEREDDDTTWKGEVDNLFFPVNAKVSDDFQSPISPEGSIIQGDPRRKAGKTLLQVLERLERAPTHQGFITFMQSAVSKEVEQLVHPAQETQLETPVQSSPPPNGRTEDFWER